MTPPRSLAVYYGWPGEVNGAGGDVGLAGEAFLGFDEIVFGEGNVLAGADPNARPVVARCAGDGATTYGYVDLGVTAGGRNWALDRVASHARAWQALGVHGLLLDCAGRDYGVDRHRFVDAVAIAHRLGLAVIVNAWDPDDVLAGETPLGPGDAYLAENVVLDAGRWVPAAAARAKLDRMRAHRDRHGVALFATATVASGHQDRVPDVVDRLTELLAPFELDALAVTDASYSARDDRLAPAVR